MYLAQKLVEIADKAVSATRISIQATNPREWVRCEVCRDDSMYGNNPFVVKIGSAALPPSGAKELLYWLRSVLQEE